MGARSTRVTNSVWFDEEVVNLDSLMKGDVQRYPLLRVTDLSRVSKSERTSIVVDGMY